MKKQKILLCLVLCLLMLTTTVFSFFSAQEIDIPQGDVNADGFINAADALDALKFAVGSLVLVYAQQLRADVNLDNTINAEDALDILRYAVGKLPAFPQRVPSLPSMDLPSSETPSNNTSSQSPSSLPSQQPSVPSVSQPDKPLTDTSTGKINPRLAPMNYSNEVMVADIIPTVDGYIVRGDAKVDCTAGIQKALNDCAKAGGGTVFLPAGKYLVTGSIQIPARVTLLGDWQDPESGASQYGTVIFAKVPSVDTNQGGLFLLGGSGGVMGLTVYYPEQSLENVKPYPPVFYTDGRGANYMLSTIKNCTVINGYRGIGACCHTVNSNAHEQLTVENFKGTFLYTAAEVYNQADVGTWENVTVSNRYWAAAKGDGMQPASSTQLQKYTYANTIGMMLGDLEWTEFIGLTIEDCKIGIEIEKGQRIQFAGSLYDVNINNCKTGISVLDLDPRWGMLIAQSVIDGGIENHTNGLVKLMNVSVYGKCTGQVTSGAQTDVKNITVPKGGYVRPAPYLVVAQQTNSTRYNASQYLQSLLDDMPATGGIVYLPADTYRLQEPIRVPANVQLRGCSAVATRGLSGGSNGTILLAYYGDGAQYDPNTDDALITLEGENAGLYGIRITYPQNTVYDTNLNTTYAVRGTAKGVYMVNCCITAAGYGVDFTNCDNHYIQKVTTCCYYNTYRLGGKNGVLSGCLQNGTVITRCTDPLISNWLMEGNIFTDLFDPVLRKTAMFIVVENAQNQTIYNTFAYGCNTMLTAKSCNNVLAVNIGCDNIGSNGAQVNLQNGGNVTVINAMRYNGQSYVNNGGVLKLYNRLTINNKNEENGIY